MSVWFYNFNYDLTESNLSAIFSRLGSLMMLNGPSLDRFVNYCHFLLASPEYNNLDISNALGKLFLNIQILYSNKLIIYGLGNLSYDWVGIRSSFLSYLSRGSFPTCTINVPNPTFLEGDWNYVISRGIDTFGLFFDWEPSDSYAILLSQQQYGFFEGQSDSWILVASSVGHSPLIPGQEDARLVTFLQNSHVGLLQPYTTTTSFTISENSAFSYVSSLGSGTTSSFTISENSAFSSYAGSSDGNTNISGLDTNTSNMSSLLSDNPDVILDFGSNVGVSQVYYEVGFTLADSCMFVLFLLVCAVIVVSVNNSLKPLFWYLYCWYYSNK